MRWLRNAVDGPADLIRTILVLHRIPAIGLDRDMRCSLFPRHARLVTKNDEAPSLCRQQLPKKTTAPAACTLIHNVLAARPVWWVRMKRAAPTVMIAMERSTGGTNVAARDRDGLRTSQGRLKRDGVQLIYAQGNNRRTGFDIDSRRGHYANSVSALGDFGDWRAKV
jgi:hypothetical protein